jgi:5'-3' exonuclease
MRLHLVDGTFELFRAHFSKRPDLRSRSGQDVKATVGLAASMLMLLEEPGEGVTHLAVAFDNPIRSFRNDLFDAYKNDEGVLPELRAQFDMAEEAMRALGIVVWSMDRFEADDALATGARRWGGEVEQVRILTPDKDLGQVLEGTRVVQVDRIRRREMDAEFVFSVRGVPPRSIPDWLALVGDSADGIPGIPGFGEKTAAALLRAYGTIENIPRNAHEWHVSVRSAERLATTLDERLPDALLYKRLATLATDVPLSESLDELAWRGGVRKEFDAWSTALGIALPTPARWRE